MSALALVQHVLFTRTFSNAMWINLDRPRLFAFVALRQVD
jgi:hypothetical protein